MTYKQKLITIAIIGFTFGGWFTLDTNGFYALKMLIVCVGLFIGLLFILAALSLKKVEEHKRFKSHGIIL